MKFSQLVKCVGSAACSYISIATSTSLKKEISKLKRISLSRTPTKEYFTTGSLVQWALSGKEGGRAGGREGGRERAVGNGEMGENYVITL